MLPSSSLLKLLHERLHGLNARPPSPLDLDGRCRVQGVEPDRPLHVREYGGEPLADPCGHLTHSRHYFCLSLDQPLRSGEEVGDDGHAGDRERANDCLSYSDHRELLY